MTTHPSGVEIKNQELENRLATLEEIVRELTCTVDCLSDKLRWNSVI